MAWNDGVFKLREVPWQFFRLRTTLCFNIILKIPWLPNDFSLRSDHFLRKPGQDSIEKPTSAADVRRTRAANGHDRPHCNRAQAISKRSPNESVLCGLAFLLRKGAPTAQNWQSPLSPQPTPSRVRKASWVDSNCVSKLDHNGDQVDNAPARLIGVGVESFDRPNHRRLQFGSLLRASEWTCECRSSTVWEDTPMHRVRHCPLEFLCAYRQGATFRFERQL